MTQSFSPLGESRCNRTSFSIIFLAFLCSTSNCADVRQSSQASSLVQRDHTVYIAVYPHDINNKQQTSTIEKYLHSIPGAKFVHRLELADDPEGAISGWSLVTEPAMAKDIAALPEVAEVASSDDPGEGIAYDEEFSSAAYGREQHNASLGADESHFLGKRALS
jgi:hypothetical protein